MRYLFSFMILHISCIALLQAQNKQLDSLHYIYKNSREDTSKILILTAIAHEYRYLKPDSTLSIAQKALAWAEEKNFDKGIAIASNRMGLANTSRNNYVLALEQQKKSLALFEKLYKKKEMAQTLYEIGIIYDYQANYPVALTYFFKSLKIREDIQDKRGIAASLNSIGIIYQNQNENEKALAYFEKSFAIKKNIADNAGMATTLNNMAIIYKKQKDYAKALDSYEKSLKIRQEVQDKRLIAASLNNIATLYEAQGKYTLALDYYEQSIQLKKEIKDDWGMIYSLNGLATIYQKKQAYLKSIEYGEQAMQIATALNALKEMREVSEVLYNSYKLCNNYPKSLEYHELYKIVSDTIFNIDKYKAIDKLETRITLEKLEKERQIAAESYQRQIEISKKQAEADRLYNLAKHESNQRKADGFRNLADKVQLEARRLRANEAKIKAENKVFSLEAQKQKEENEFRQTIIYFILLGLIGIVIFTFFIFRSKQQEKKANDELRFTLDIVNENKKEIEHKNKAIMDSINYAKRIQTAILPSDDDFKNALPSSFVFFQPRDIVSGDFYFLAQKEHKTIVAAVDCTGHGVPGALMSMMGKEIIAQIIDNYKIYEADLILNELHKGVRKALKQADNRNHDGMDLALVVIDNQQQEVQFAGAKNPIVYIQNGELFYIKGDKETIGGQQREKDRVFTRHTIPFSQESDTMIYLFSDGFQDQFGGVANKKISIARLKELFLSIHQQPMLAQHNALKQYFATWVAQSNAKQIDDVLILGICLPTKL